MKKLLSITMATIIMLTSLFSGIGVMADEVKGATQLKVAQQMKGSADLLVNDKTAFSLSNAGDLYTLIKSGKDMSAYKDEFVKEIKTNLDVNDGQLILTDTQWYEDENGEWQSKESKVESAFAYGAVILIFDAYGLDYKGYKGYNIASAYEELDISKINDNPYNYYLAVQGAQLAQKDKLVKALCDKLIKDYYVTDKGMEYYGFSCDNTAMLIYTLAPYYNTYKDTIDNAVKVLEGYRKDNGYFNSLEYGPSVNCNSTALALCAYSALNNTDKIKSIYNELCAFELNGKAGQFDYTDNKEANIFATSDALLALEAMNEVLTPCFDSHSFSADSPVCTLCGEENPDYVLSKVTGLTTTARTTSSATISWNQITGAQSYIVYKYNNSTNQYDYIAQTKDTKYKLTSLKAGQVISVKVCAVRNNKLGDKSDTFKTNANPLQGKISSLSSSKKKKLTVKLSSKLCTGYQIQWSTSSKFTSNYKSVYVSQKTTSKTITTAQSKKKYYVRVRAYTTINGTKIYGKWSATKSITVK